MGGRAAGESAMIVALAFCAVGFIVGAGSVLLSGGLGRSAVDPPRSGGRPNRPDDYTVQEWQARMDALAKVEAYWWDLFGVPEKGEQ